MADARFVRIYSNLGRVALGEKIVVLIIIIMDANQLSWIARSGEKLLYGGGVQTFQNIKLLQQQLLVAYKRETYPAFKIMERKEFNGDFFSAKKMSPCYKVHKKNF